MIIEINTQPVSSTVIASNDVTLTCSATYVSTITYSWHRVGGSVPSKSSGQNSNRLTIPRVVPADEGEYYCLAESLGHCAKSNKAVVIVDGKKIAPYMICTYVNSYINFIKIINLLVLLYVAQFLILNLRTKINYYNYSLTLVF